jgi:DtxR family Mn-dependent transcriptional regulator
MYNIFARLLHQASNGEESMSQQVIWKSFEENQLTHSAAHYLMAINELMQDQGYARVTDIAKTLNITRGSCSISLKPLKKRGLVLEDQNKFMRLSAEGNQLVRLIEKNDKLLEALFRDVLGVGTDQAEIDACKIEHLLSIETSAKLERFISFLDNNKNLTENFLSELHKHPACSTLESSDKNTIIPKERTAL